MTIEYSPDNFFRVMFGYWRGSLFKMVFKMMAFYLLVYYAFYATYYFALAEDVIDGSDRFRPDTIVRQKQGLPCERTQRQLWREVVAYVRDIEDYFDLSFLLGFFVMLIVSRWWSQAVLVILKCQPDTFIRTMCSFVAIKDQKSRILRRTFARWCVCIQALSWRSISSRLLKRLPTEDHLITIGLLTEKEREMLNKTSVSGYDRYMIPALWIFNLINRCKTEKLIDSWQATAAKETLEQYFDAHRTLWIYSWLSVPLAYTQVAFLATHAFFLVTVLGRQPVLYTDVDTYFPLFMCIQFLFYMGWLQVAEALIDPFGEDDEDYEMNYLLDTNAHNAFMIADSVERTSTSIVPELRDATWDVRYDYQIPHTKASRQIAEIIPKGNKDVRKYKPSRDDVKTLAEVWQQKAAERIKEEASKEPISVEIKFKTPDN